MRLIDADRLSNELGKLWRIPKDWDGGMNQACEDAFTMIDYAPTIDAVEVVHGRWIENRISATFSCSECGSKINDNRLYAWELHPMEKYCPNCGAKMHCDEND